MRVLLFALPLLLKKANLQKASAACFCVWALAALITMIVTAANGWDEVRGAVVHVLHQGARDPLRGELGERQQPHRQPRRVGYCRRAHAVVR